MRIEKESLRLIVFCFTLTLKFSFGQTTTSFNGSTSVNWNNSSNWSSSNIANAITENANITASVTLVNGDNFTIGNLTPSNGVTVTINNGAALTIGSSSTSKAVTGSAADGVTFVVNGTLEVWGNFTLHDNAKLTLSTGGSLIVHGNFAMSGDFSATLASGASVTVTGTTSFTDSNATLSGSGSWSSSSCTPSGSGFCTDGQLPVKLINFSSLISENEIELKWATSSEINFDYFELEKSTDGKSFYSLGKIKGHGTSSATHQYSFIDQNPTIGRNYYRLASVDFDNYRETFRVISQLFDGTKQMNVHPNPTDGKVIYFDFNFPLNENVRVKVYNNVGLHIGDFEADDQQKIVFQNKLNSGIYFVNFSSLEFNKTIRLVVN